MDRRARGQDAGAAGRRAARGRAGPAGRLTHNALRSTPAANRSGRGGRNSYPPSPRSGRARSYSLRRQGSVYRSAAPLFATSPTLREANQRPAKRTALAALALASLAGAGCGDGRKPSQAQFSARAQAICTAEARKLGYIQQRARAREVPAEAPAVLRKEAAASRAATAELEAIGRPRGQGAAVERWLTARTVAATIAIDLAEAPSGKERKAVAALAAELRRARGRALALSDRFGRGACDAAL